MTIHLLRYAKRRWPMLLLVLFLVTAGALGAFWWPQVTSAATRLTTTDPVTAAWQKAQAAGSYHFTSDVLQKTIPVASLTNVGRGSRSETLYLEGQNDLHDQRLELTLWSQGGSTLNAASGVSLRTENGKAYTRRGNEPWQEGDNFVDGFAPQGDFLGYLVAIRQVTAGATETRGGITFTRYTFTLDGPAFAAYMHEQMIAAMRAKGELPPGVQLDPPAYYRDMTGRGELWVGTNGLPVRQILTLNFPEQNEERVEAAVTVNFTNYGAEQSGLWTLLRTGQWQGAWLVLPSRLPDLTGLWLGLTLSVAAFLAMRYRRTRAVQTAIVSAVIVSQVVGPVLSAMTETRFFDTYRAKAAAQEEQQAAAQTQHTLQSKVLAGPAFNPHQNLVASAVRGQSSVGSPQSSVVGRQWASTAQSPNLQLSDPGTDTDQDGLTDFTEVRIGTSEVFTDTDNDGVMDNLEVNGFQMGGQTWYTDPTVTDSNNDGLSDILEWGIDSVTALPQATPRDTDGDGLPDLFDPDNDNDGVPDRVDMAPLVYGASTYTGANPLQLTINNLTPGKPTFVDFQIRPTDPKNLGFAYTVLDWPQDSDGQIRDVDSKSYADIAAAAGLAADASENNGDMKAIPMLEIRLPAASANLPSQAELTPFGISVNDFTADGQTKVAYVPLTMVTDPLTGERVAFSGQMRYKPTGSWTLPHSVRLAWVVQSLNDLPCDPKAADAAAQGCQADGYIHNQSMMVHSYYDDWALTGLSVREDNGASMGIVYEDPVADPNKKDDAPLWALTDVLSEHFLKPHDANNDQVRDLKVNDLPARFDRDNNPTDAQRFSIPNIMQVVTNSYTTADEAAMSTAMTTTTSILNTVFKASVQADNAIKPLLLFVTENNLRVVGLGDDSYATQQAATVSLDLAPTADTALPVTVEASLKWMTYCGVNGNNVTWRPCTSDEAAATLEARYANAPSLPDDTNPAAVPGRMMLALSYYFTLVGGYQAEVQEGAVISSSRYQLEGESDTATRLRIGFNSVTPLPQIVFQSLIHLGTVATEDPARGKTLIGQMKIVRDNLGVTYYQAKKALAIKELDASSEDTVQLTKQLVKDTKLSLARKLTINFTRYAAAAPVGSAIMLITNVLSQVPEVGAPARGVLGAIGALVTFGVSVYLPAVTASELYKFSLNNWTSGNNTKTPKPTLAKQLTKTLIKALNMRIASGVGLALNVALIWGFFGYAAGASGLAGDSLELRKSVVEAVASTLVAVYFALLSLTFIGTIIVGLITIFDAIFNLICELGVSALRNAPGLGGACFSITTAATKALAYFLYNYEPMVDTSRSDLMIAGTPQVTLADPSQGYVPSNAFTLTLPVTTTAIHKDPDPANGLLINFYLWLFSPDNLRTSTFKYGLSQGAPANQAVEVNQMPGAWQNVREDHKYVLTPMYRGVASTDPAPLSGLKLTQGINSTVPFSLTMNFAVPADECFLIPIPYVFIIIPTPICHTRDLKNSNTMPFTSLTYDVLPNTVHEFFALTSKPSGGLGQSWDARFPALADADGDGLRSAAANGLDPDDSTWDADGDGLSDRFELNQRTAGAGYSPLVRDTDGDGLTDKQEYEISTDPALVDTDNDGLPDGVEVRHQVYDATGKLTNTWTGGWQVTLNTTPARTIWVSSDPFNADSDQDGVSDQAEKELAANANAAVRLDNQGLPYHPQVPNTPPLAVLTASDAFNGYVGAGQTFQYTTTVIAHAPVAPGVLNITAPAVVGGAPNPLALDFTASPTVTQATGFTVAGNAVDQSFFLTSTVSTRLPDISNAPWVWQTPSTETGLGTFSTRLGRLINAAALTDRQDSYRLVGVASTFADGGPGDIWGYNLPAGTATLLDTDPAGGTSGRSDTPATVACNLHNYCLAVWEKKPSGFGNGQLMGVVIQPGGNVTTLPFMIADGTVNISANSNPKIASDGTNFLIAWQQGVLVSGTEVTYRSNLMTRPYNESGLPLAAATMLPNEQIDVFATTSASIQGLNSSRYSHQQIDLDWLNGRYRLTRWLNLGTASTASDVTLTENGVATTNRQITWRDIDANGALIANSKVTINGLLSGFPTALSLSYHPIADRVLLAVAGFDSVEASPVIAVRTFAGTTTNVSRSYTLLSTAATNNVAAVYYPPQQGYLIGWSPTSNATNFTYKLFDSNVNELTDFGAPPAVTWPTATNTAVGTSLACPAISSQPVVDLPFEELPGVSDFIDNSGYNTAVFCDAGQCPVAGVSGAPNATRSDYALRFDGVNDRLFVNRALSDDFTIALWIKTAGQPTPGMLVDQGPTLTNGWGLYLNGSQLIFQGNQQISANANLSDNQWHFITVTRSRGNGNVAIYKDGVFLNNGPHNIALLNAQSEIWLGGNAANESNFAYKGDMDAVQFYPVALTASTVQALYNRTLQSYCVAAGVTATGNTFPWSRIGLQQQDVRGGRISASGSLKVRVDKTAPTARYTSHPNFAVVTPDTVIGGTASDSGIGVAKVEVSLNGGPWQLATGANTWSFALNVPSGIYGVQARATDLAGNVGFASQSINIWVDETAPALTINAAAATLKPTKNAAGQWQVPVSGTATDDHDLKAGTLLVQLTQASGVGVAQTQQAATFNGSTWSMNYLLDPSLFDPTGSYTVTAQVDDSVGNRTVAAAQVVRLDATGPVAALGAPDLARTVITQTLTIGGVISDTNSVVGLDRAEIAFTPVEQLAALPVGLTSTQAEAQLNRQWLPVTLAQRGAGVTQSTWSVAIPTGLENSYQIDLRGYDLLGNVSITSGLWQGIIDTRDPRVVMTATATGATYVNTADNTQRYEVRFVCGVQDRNLNESSFVCPGEGLAEPVRSFENNPALQALFPDLTLRTGLAISYTLWTTSTTPAATARACDAFGRCAQAATGTVVGAAAGAVNSETVQGASLQAAAAAPGAPLAVIVNPTAGSFVAAGNALSVTVAAEAAAGVKDVTIKLDNVTVQTLSFAQSPVITRTVRTINVPVATEGAHTLVAQATNWANATQTTLFPVSFTLDKSAPTLTIDPAALTLADTWVPQSGVLRFDGTASDSVGLAAVQIREGNNGFTDATFGNGTWRVALPVTDPEGRTLNITVRAIDRAGRITQVNQAITTQLSAADAPDTRIVAGPANPSATNSASFVFTSTVSAFECSLDNGAYTPCTSPASYSDLSKGSHTFLARAIDGRGLPDLTPATFTWNVNASAVDATITGKPANPTTDRTATFAFSGGAGAVSFECSLDGSAYSVCTSPKVYTTLGNGDHTFLVRARNSANLAGAADRATWTVNNVAPVAQSQSLIATPNTPVKVTLTATDNEPLTYKIVTPPGHGVLMGTPPTVTYLPDKDYGFTDRFTFLATDGLLDSNVATVTVLLDNVPPVVTVTGVTTGATYPLGNVPPAGCKTVDLASGVAISATLALSGGNAHGVGNFTAICSPATDKMGNTSLPVTALYTVTYNLNKFVVLGQEGIAFEQNLIVNSGDLGARVASAGPYLANNAEVSLGQTGKVLDATSHLLGNTLVLGAGASAYNPSYNVVRNSGQLLGVKVTPLNLKLMPSLPALPTITAGTAAVNVAQNGALTLNPGNYGAFTSIQNGTITFKGGVYQFASFTAGQGTKLYFQAPTEIRVTGKVSIGQDSIVGPAPTATTLKAQDIVFYVAGRNGVNGTITETPKAVAIGQNSRLKLNLLAPNGTVQLDQNISATGAFLGRWVKWGQYANLTLASRFGTGSVAAAALAEPDPAVPASEAVVVSTLYLPLVTVDGTVDSEAVDSEAVDSEAVDSEAVDSAVVEQWNSEAVDSGTVTLTTPVITSTLSLTATVPVTAVVVPTTTTPAAETGAAPHAIFLPLLVR